jgi:hypothetical protein
VPTASIGPVCEPGPETAELLLDKRSVPQPECLTVGEALKAEAGNGSV